MTQMSTGGRKQLTARRNEVLALGYRRPHAADDGVTGWRRGDLDVLSLAGIAATVLISL